MGIRIDGAVKDRFLAGIRDGLPLEQAAAQAGASLQGLYGARRRDPGFGRAWVAALQDSSDAERADRARGKASGPVRITSCNRRRRQKRVIRHKAFTAAGKLDFLAHLAGTCDWEAAAAAAGIDASTAYRHRRADPDFAAACEDALQTGYLRLEMEAVRQRLDAQQQLRGGVLPAGEISTEFDRVLKLLAQWKRRDGRIGMREIAPGRQKRWSFEDAMRLLDRKLNALGVPKVDPDTGLPLLTPPRGGESDA